MHDDLTKTMDELRDLKDRTKDQLKMMYDSGCLSKAEVCDLSNLTDMIKDLAEAEERCAKACYYKKVVEYMDEEYGNPSMGYNNRRYANGEYAPKGRGEVRGFNPMTDEDHMVDYPRMGAPYPRPRMHSVQTGSDHRMVMGYDDGIWYNDTFREYDEARKHYSKTGKDEDREKMSERGIMHVQKALDTIREIWGDADPAMRKQLKADMSEVVTEMGV